MLAALLCVTGKTHSPQQRGFSLSRAQIWDLQQRSIDLFNERKKAKEKELSPYTVAMQPSERRERINGVGVKTTIREKVSSAISSIYPELPDDDEDDIELLLMHT